MVFHCVKCNLDKIKRDMKTKSKSRQGVCKSCYAISVHQQRQNIPSTEIQPIFHPTLRIHSHLSIEKRASIVAFHRIGMNKENIMKYLSCSMPTVNYWIKHYNEHFNVINSLQSINLSIQPIIIHCY
jgi:hypothetical protein